MVSEFVVVWGELNWLRDVAGSAFFVKRDARQACAACHRGFVGGWLLGCRNSAKTASKILKLASEDAQTVRIFEATQISASQESAPLLQSRSQPAPVSPAVRFRAGGSGGGVGRLAEVGIDEGWRIEWIPGSWMSHQRCAGWLGGRAEFLVEAIVAVVDG